ncbi:MAG TPA: hypothetical protein VN667_08350 [Burkholderiales bacterium]|nr:hypothetical protein [Burkholderiales bacterium]
MNLPAESVSFLAAHGRAYLYVLAADGTARGWPMIARYHDGVLVMTTYRKAPKTPHLAQAKRATVVVTSDEGASPFRYAVAEGPLSLRDITPDMADEVTRSIHGATPGGTEISHFRARLLEGKRALIEVRVDSAPLHTLEAA